MKCLRSSQENTKENLASKYRSQIERILRRRNDEEQEKLAGLLENRKLYSSSDLKQSSAKSIEASDYANAQDSILQKAYNRSFAKMIMNKNFKSRNKI